MIGPPDCVSFFPEIQGNIHERAKLSGTLVELRQIIVPFNVEGKMNTRG